MYMYICIYVHMYMYMSVYVHPSTVNPPRRKLSDELLDADVTRYFQQFKTPEVLLRLLLYSRYRS